MAFKIEKDIPHKSYLLDGRLHEYSLPPNKNVFVFT